MPRTKEHHLHLPFFTFDASANMKFLYAIRVVRDMINKLAIFFLPIYLYILGQNASFWQFLPGNDLQKGILLLCIFYLVHRSLVLVAVVPIGKLIAKIGYDQAISIGFIFYAIFLLAMFGSQTYGWLVLLGAVANGLETCFFWMSYQPLMSKLALKRKVGQDLGLLQFLLQLAQATAPAIGGYLIVAYGFGTIFLVGLLGVVVGINFALHLKLNQDRDKINYQEFFSWLKEKQFLRLLASTAGRYINDAAIVIWPLYVFLILKTVEGVGFLYTFSLFMALILSFVVGYYVDHQKSNKPFYTSGGLLSVLWMLKMQVWSFWQIAIIDTLDKMTSNFHWLFFDAKTVKRSQGSQALSFYVYREIIISLTAIIFWLVVAAIFLWVVNAWQTLFVIAAVGVMLSLLIKEHYNKL